MGFLGRAAARSQGMETVDAELFCEAVKECAGDRCSGDAGLEGLRGASAGTTACLDPLLLQPRSIPESGGETEDIEHADIFVLRTDDRAEGNRCLVKGI